MKEFLMTGELIYMAINMKKFLFIFLLLQFPFLESDTMETDLIKKLEPVYLNIEDFDNIQNYVNFKEKNYKIIKDSLAIKYNNDPRLSGLNRIGKYVYETKKGTLHSLINRSVNKELNEIVFFERQLRVLVDESENIFFTDGSIIIYFKEKIDLSNFSKSYGIVLKRAFPSANAAVFFTPLDKIEDTMATIQENDYVKSVNFDVIDPNVLPE